MSHQCVAVLSSHCLSSRAEALQGQSIESEGPQEAEAVARGLLQNSESVEEAEEEEPPK